MKEQFFSRYGLALLWLISVPIYIFGGFHVLYYPEGQFGVILSRNPSYPYLEVLASIVLSGIVIIVLYLIIRVGRYLAIRLLAALIILGAAGFFMLGFTDTGYFDDLRFLWLSIVIVSLFVAFVITLYRSRLIKDSPH